MGLRDILRKDIARREHIEAASEKLIKRWRAELAAAPPEPAQHIPLPRTGIDFAFGRPHPAQLRQAGVTFVCRYLGGTSNKDLTQAEAEDYSHGGLDIVTVWEGTATRALHGYDAGAQDARSAAAQLRRLGAPAHAVIYFAVDFDAQDFQLKEIEAYFRGAADHLGHSRCGVYGGLRAVSHLLSLGIVRYGWQTFAWSHGQWSTRAQLRQTRNDIHVAGVDCDRDSAVAADFGQWKV